MNHLINKDEQMTRNNNFVGRNIKDVEKELTEKNQEFRIESEDGQHYMLTMDFNQWRLNFSVNDGIITAVSNG